jgi:hypothetical protein
MATDRFADNHSASSRLPATAPDDRRASHTPGVGPRKLWFGFVTSTGCWVLLGCLDLLITWRACMYQEEYGLPSHPGGATIFYLTASLLLLVLTIAAGVTSYRNWRSLSLIPNILESQAVERSEFMALLGVIISITLGVGIVLLALPPLFLSLCWRAR